MRFPVLSQPMDMQVSAMASDETWLAAALEEARAAAARGEVPVGAVLVSGNGQVLARDGNRILELRDPTAHAELLTLRAAARVLGNERLIGTTLYVTLEPCTMCAGAISFARVARLVYAAADPKGGAIEHGARFFEQPTCHHRPLVTRLDDAGASGRLLVEFFRARRV
jgi:tRNA(Arg) A34 adenosine deaminase TadA